MKPNILFIQTDQLTAFALSAYGNRFSKTPNLNKLAAHGQLFETAYCNFPLCAPSRYSMAAGQLASRIGAYDNAAEFPASIPTYAHYLRQAGYQTCLSGKMHFVGPDQLHGFEERLTPDIYPADFSWAPNWECEGQRDTSDTTGVTVSGKCAGNVQLDYDNLVQEEALNKLSAIAISEDRRPFFLQVSFTHPHDPYLCLEKHWDLYHDINIPLPTVAAMPGIDHDNHSRRILAQHGMLDYEFDPADTVRARRAYYGSVSYIDDRVGELLEKLELLGMSDNTVIVFTSDHGEMLGERGMWFKKTFFEHALRVPLIVHVPNVQPRRIEAPVSLVDLLPTFLALANASDIGDEVESLDGSNILGFHFQSKMETARKTRAIYAEYLSETTPAPIYMIRRGRFKFISSVEDPDLLFNLETDPAELINLAEDAEYKDMVVNFRGEVEVHWDNESLTRDIKLSQRRRSLVNRAMRQGPMPSWDYQEEIGDDVPWYRGQQGYNKWAYDFIPVTDKNRTR